MSNTQRTYTVAIAGMGKRGSHHADAFAANPRFNIVGLCDIDPGRLDTAAEKYDVSYINTNAVQMLSESKPDVFCFCTLPSVRLSLIQAGVEAKVKLIAYENYLKNEDYEVSDDYDRSYRN